MMRPACVVVVLLSGALLAGELKLSEAKWDFEDGTLQGWTVVSGNLGKQPSSNDNDRWGGNFGKHGKYFIGTYEDGPRTIGDQVQGEVRSPVFVIDTDFIGLLVGGGHDINTTCVALCDADNDKELMKLAGTDAEAMTERRWDVSKLQGKRAYLKVVDKASGGWGHINVDYMRALTKEELARIEQEKREAELRAREAEAEMHRKWAGILDEWGKTVLDPMPRKVYSGKALASCQMPMGGIGAGNFAVCGDGHFRQWMIFGSVNFAAIVPDSFFAIRAKLGDTTTARLLRTGPNGVKDIDFVGEYPIAYHTFKDDALPVKVSMESFSPFIPLNEKDSAIPAVVFIITVENPGDKPVEAALLVTLQNAVGYDGKSPINGVECAGYGRNSNVATEQGDWKMVNMIRAQHNGSMALAARDASARALVPWTSFDDLWAGFSAGQLRPAEGPSTGSPNGKTINAAIEVPLRLEPGQKKQVPFAYAWHFPGGPRTSSRYEADYERAADVIRYLGEGFERLVSTTRLYHDTFFDSTLPYYVLDRVSSQSSIIRTRVVSWTKAGNVYGWEGLGGKEGCCHGSCTHVWNYEQSLAHLFPALERSLREINLRPGMQPSGAVHNRFVTPDSPWGGGNEGPAADGHASTISKAYREYRLCTDDTWLKQQYPAVQRAMEFWIKNWDGPDEDGVARGQQFNTYDTSVVGPNTFIGTQYLAALLAATEMAKVCGDDASARRWRAIFEKGSQSYATECWDDELKYFVQRIPEGQRANDYGNGCHCDQLLGQWWALVNGLDYVLPRPKVDQTLATLFKWNMVGDISMFRYRYPGQRIFIWDKGKGLMICSWPRGDYIANPILYSQEVWTGCEYQVAATMIWEGLIREGLMIVKAAHERYTDGVRNPWDEIECGSNYARAMSSWSVLLAAQGKSYIGPRGEIGFDPRLAPDSHKSFFSTAAGWGSFSQKRTASSQENLLELKWGELRVSSLTLGLPANVARVTATVDGVDGRPATTVADGKLVIRFDPAVTLSAPQVVRVKATW